MTRLALLLILFMPMVSCAQGLIIRGEYKLDDKGYGEGEMKLFVTVTFDDGKPLIGGRVQVIGATGVEKQSAMTDSQGMAVFPGAYYGMYTITADDGGKHTASIPFDRDYGVKIVEAPKEMNPWLMLAIRIGVIAILVGGTLWIFARRRKKPFASERKPAE